MEIIGIVQYHEMPATIHVSYLTYHKMNKCYLEMLGTYPIAGMHETVRYCNVICMTYTRCG